MEDNQNLPQQQPQPEEVNPPSAVEEVVVSNPPVQEEVIEEVVTEEVTEEEPPKEEDPEDSPAADSYFDQLREEMVSKGVDFTEMDSKIHRGESLSAEEIALVAEHTPFPPDAIKSFTDLLGKNLVLLNEKKAQTQAALEVERQERMKAVDEAAGGSYQELATMLAAKAPTTKVAIWKAAIEGSDDLEVHKAVASEMKAYSESLSEQAPAPDKRSDLGVLTKSSASTGKPSETAGDVDVPHELAEAAQLEADKEQAAKVALVDKMSAAQLAQVRRIGPAHPLYTFVDARLNQLLGLGTSE